jgi:hypothetical protein
MRHEVDRIKQICTTGAVHRWSELFVRDGMVVVEDALDRGFCEEVVAGRLADLGVDEADTTTWRTGWHNLPPTTAHPLATVAPRAAEVLVELVGGIESVSFGDLPDNLIINFPSPATRWWPPEQWDAPGAGWHKDGDWFRHFLDSPEQALLTIVFWRDVAEHQGPTYVAVDSIGPIARLLAAHPEGLDPSAMGAAVQEVVAGCRDFRALTGRQGTIVFAHPFLAHTSSVNVLDRLRIISNTSVMLREPLRFDRPDDAYSAVERSILAALDVDRLDYQPAGERRRVTSTREARWEAAQSPG